MQGPMVDMEVRGIPALQYFGNLVWQPALDEISSGALLHPCPFQMRLKDIGLPIAQLYSSG